ncbi:hypothetical protein M4D76_16220 [Peribacillus frigoritolerans]|uniref:hypothetical protein n=1 Tax=Peribacillus frigoritolerans TaxID=450367 RepID=UPI0021A895EC|nr:hypothetical protein [Peribacillus frigoritolerans]MCT1389842.1 hypothetical protein [Peribacillus frigoritolerans]
MKFNILTNKEINHLIEISAKKIGTSKRNITSIALTDILNRSYTLDDIEQLKVSIQLNYATTITINESVGDKINQIYRHGLSKRVFFGYLICDYFYTNYNYFLTKNDLNDDKEFNTEKDYIQIKIDKTIKSKISTYSDENAISINSLFAHYILNKELTVKSYCIEGEELLYLTFSKDVKDIIKKNSSEMNISYRFYLNLIAAQICNDLF